MANELDALAESMFTTSADAATAARENVTTQRNIATQTDDILAESIAAAQQAKEASGVIEAFKTEMSEREAAAIRSANEATGNIITQVGTLDQLNRSIDARNGLMEQFMTQEMPNIFTNPIDALSYIFGGRVSEEEVIKMDNQVRFLQEAVQKSIETASAVAQNNLNAIDRTPDQKTQDANNRLNELKIDQNLRQERSQTLGVKSSISSNIAAAEERVADNARQTFNAFVSYKMQGKQDALLELQLKNARSDTAWQEEQRALAKADREYLRKLGEQYNYTEQQMRAMVSQNDPKINMMINRDLNGSYNVNFDNPAEFTNAASQLQTIGTTAAEKTTLPFMLSATSKYMDPKWKAGKLEEIEALETQKLKPGLNKNDIANINSQISSIKTELSKFDSVDKIKSNMAEGLVFPFAGRNATMIQHNFSNVFETPGSKFAQVTFASPEAAAFAATNQPGARIMREMAKATRKNEKGESLISERDTVDLNFYARNFGNDATEIYGYLKKLRELAVEQSGYQLFGLPTPTGRVFVPFSQMDPITGAPVTQTVEMNSSADVERFIIQSQQAAKVEKARDSASDFANAIMQSLPPL